MNILVYILKDNIHIQLLDIVHAYITMIQLDFFNFCHFGWNVQIVIWQAVDDLMTVQRMLCAVA